jgi:peptidoglycan/LPS O-acetylase OafA/YrhL
MHTAKHLTLPGLQAGRGIAALLVLIYHATTAMHADGVVSVYFEYIGRRGVDFFFVLSGFIIYFVHRADIGQPKMLSKFLLKRTLRIYPPYWVLITFYLVFYALFLNDGDHDQLQPANIVKGVLLYPIENKPYNIPTAWTLSHELLFYLIFAGAIFNRKLGAICMVLWGTAIALALSSYPLFFPLGFILNPRNLEFFIGIGVAHLVQIRTTNNCASHSLLVGGILGFAAVGLAECFTDGFDDGPLVLCYGISSAITIFAIASLDIQGHLDYPAPILMLGDASYSIYIVHFPIVLMASKVLARISPIPYLGWYEVLAVVGLVGAGTIGGIAFHIIVERPLQQRIRTFLRSDKSSLS